MATDAGYVSIPDSSALRPTSALTIEAWVKLNRMGGDLICKNSAYMLSVGKAVPNDSNVVSATFWLSSGSTQAVTGTLPIPVGVWTHLAATYNSTTYAVSIYINGVLDTTTTLSGAMNAGTASVLLGRNSWNTMGSEVDGKIDSFRVSKIARQFLPLYPSSAGAPTPPGNLVPNGDFEMGLMGWRTGKYRNSNGSYYSGYGDANLTWETTGGAFSGKKCLHSLPSARTDFATLIPSSQSSGPAPLWSRPIPAHPGRQYTLYMRVKTASGSVTPPIAVNLLGASIQPVISFNPTVTSSWTLLTQTFTVPSTSVAPFLVVGIGYPSSGDLYVDDVRLIAGDGPNILALKDKVGVGPANALPVGNLYFANVASPTTLNIVNTDTIAHTVTVQPTIVDWEGNQVSGVPSLGSFTVPAGGVKTATYNIDTSRRGTFRLGFNLTSEGQTWHQSAEIQYAVVVNMQGVGNANSSLFAMNMHLDREPADHLARETQVLAQCGIKWIRAWWCWEVCENPEGTYDFTEYDRQFNAIDGAQMSVMSVLLRGGTNVEQDWAGSTATQQQPPDPSMMGEWGIFCGKVALHYAGQVKAYEIWNEPTSSNNGAITASIYANILNAAAPNIRANDPNATIVGFAGVPTSFITSVLALGTASDMDVVSDHPYGAIMLPEINIPSDVSGIKSVLSSGGASGKPIWFSEAGMMSDDDGYELPSISEQDAAQIAVRDFVVSAAQGVQRFFWFCADATPTYGVTIFYGNYVPRPRLAAIAACASFIEGMPYQKSYTPSGANTYAYMFEGTSQATCVVWNTVSAMTLTLAIAPGKIQAFDTMGNALTVGSANGGASSTIQIAAERPAYLQCNVADYSTLDSAVGGMQVATLAPISVTASPVVGGVQVTVTGTGSTETPADGVVSLVPAASKTPAGWPAAQRFQSLALGQSITLRFSVPNKAGVKSVQVSAGSLRMATYTFPYTGR